MQEQASIAPSQHHFRTGWMLAVGGTALFALKSIFIKLAYVQGVDTVAHVPALSAHPAPSSPSCWRWCCWGNRSAGFIWRGYFW
jgi:hypothetical protein